VSSAAVTELRTRSSPVDRCFVQGMTSAAKLTEKIRRPNYGTLEIEMTIDDPKSYTAPWTVTLRQPLVLDSELLDYYCLENEKSWVHMK